ncbi:MAG: (Fe-S)-binding protein, partial [Planctomycetia bacterium]|nr:(Fe-S)-binding protein [Planctomycetia bacterium]
DETIAAATLWSCTACGACVDACPLGVRPLDMITDLRRFLVGDGQLRGAPAAALQKMQRSGNPWGLPPGERMRWAEGLDVPTAADHPQFELLYWVGCAAAYDRRLQQVARSVVRLLRRAGVDFAVLGNEERCTGDAARRMGDELLFQELAAANIATLTRYRVTKIVTHCPHCLNAFRQDYPQLGGHFEVVHHTQLLTELVRAGRLSRTEALSPTEQTVTFHDPCYLARVSGETAAPRELLCGLGGQSLVEMERHGRQTSCCGAGGGRMWFDDNAIERPGVNRAREALATRAETLAVACPFCLLMLTDSVAAAGGSTTVRDVAELLEQDQPQPSA